MTESTSWTWRAVNLFVNILSEGYEGKVIGGPMKLSEGCSRYLLYFTVNSDTIVWFNVIYHVL